MDSAWRKLFPIFCLFLMFFPFSDCRYVSWACSILRPLNKFNQSESIAFSSANYSNYYVQEEADDGVVMESPVPVKDVSRSLNTISSSSSAYCVLSQWPVKYKPTLSKGL